MLLEKKVAATPRSAFYQRQLVYRLQPFLEKHLILWSHQGSITVNGNKLDVELALEMAQKPLIVEHPSQGHPFSSVFDTA